MPATQIPAGKQLKAPRPAALGASARTLQALSVLLLSCVVALSGCGGATVAAKPANDTFTISPSISSIDTNCTGCNATNAHGVAMHRFTATLTNGGSTAVTWSVSSNSASAGTISPAGQYTPPSYLTADREEVLVTATLKSNPSIQATALLTLTPGFQQPLTPENVAVGANGAVTLTGRLAEAGGSNNIRFALSNTPNGSTGGEGTLGATRCSHSSHAFTSCTVTYVAPPVVPSTGVTYVVATAGDSSSKTEAMVLLNPAGVASNPASHQSLMNSPMQLGSSGGNNNDFDAHGNIIADCCSGTLGSLIQDATGRQFLLSNNHVLARSDHATVGDAIVQPGLIDNNCTRSGDGPGTIPVGVLTGWLPLRSAATNADAAIAQVASHTVDPTGSILEFGSRQSDGSLAAAPPGTSSSGGKGQLPALGMRVAKSGRTTGLTCGGVSALDVDVSVDYYRDCAETRPYLTKAFSNQIALSGDRFSDAGDSGALVVDTANAEPVGLFFAGGTDASGVGQAMANPANDVLSELSAQFGGTSYTFVGTTDHAVSCLSYGDSTVAAAQARALSNIEIAHGQHVLILGRTLMNPNAGILGVAMGKSSDSPGEAALIVYVDENAPPPIPATVDGVRTLVIPTNARAIASGSAALTNLAVQNQAIPSAAFSQAVAVKRQIAHSLMQKNSAFFGVGFGQSLDNPREAALVIYVDRKHQPARLPTTISGVRTRYVVMDRFHVTRAYTAPFQSPRVCAPQPAAQPQPFDPSSILAPRPLQF